MNEQITRDDSVGARVFVSSLATPTKPQTEDTQRKPQRPTHGANHSTNEPRLLYHPELHTTQRIRTWKKTHSGTTMLNISGFRLILLLGLWPRLNAGPVFDTQHH